ncbi:hypothetical protein AO398_26960 [Methylobacterium sp. GXS13]|jgi:sulfite oxidase|nr:hypothetical protein [Methylobacterium sp. GXS13]KST56721.1 hypothetical protein AO398_26960 [Methylobacterium sp. GXS13]
MALNAATCEPAHGAVLSVGACRVRGYAVAGDRAVIHIDVSGDGGRTRIQATFEQQPDVPFA